MSYQRKTLVQIACIIAVAVIAAFIIKNLSPKSEHPAKVPPQQQKVTATALPGPAKKRPGARVPGTGYIGMPAENGTTEEIAREGVAEDTAEDPEKTEKRAVLEKQIRELTQEKEKGQQELNKLLAAVAEAQNKSQLSDGVKQGKEYEVLFLKLYMIRMLNEKLASVDSALKEKLTEYNSVIKKPDEPVVEFPDE